MGGPNDRAWSWGLSFTATGTAVAALISGIGIGAGPARQVIFHAIAGTVLLLGVLLCLVFAWLLRDQDPGLLPLDIAALAVLIGMGAIGEGFNAGSLPVAWAPIQFLVLGVFL